jgi:hypothetical protein
MPLVCFGLHGRHLADLQSDILQQRQNLIIFVFRRLIYILNYELLSFFVLICLAINHVEYKQFGTRQVKLKSFVRENCISRRQCRQPEDRVTVWYLNLLSFKRLGTPSSIAALLRNSVWIFHILLGILQLIKECNERETEGWNSFPFSSFQPRTPFSPYIIASLHLILPKERYDFQPILVFITRLLKTLHHGAYWIYSAQDVGFNKV